MLSFNRLLQVVGITKNISLRVLKVVTMKFIFSLLLAFFFFASLNAQFNFDKSERDIEEFNDNGKEDLAFKMLNGLRSERWDSLNCREKAIVYKLYGNTHYSRYEDDKALVYYVDSFYNRVIECNLKSLENDLLNNVGLIYNSAGKQLLANKYYNKLRVNYLSKELLPTQKSFDHLTNLASFYDDYGNLYNSFLCAWKAKEIGENLKLNLDEVYNLLGIYFEATRQYDEAIRNYSEAIRYSSKGKNSLMSSFIVNQASAYRGMKDYNKALETLNLAKLNKNSDEQHYAILNLEALIYAEQGDFEKSELIYSQMDKMGSANIDNIYHVENRADLKFKMGDYKNAIKIYKSLISDIEQSWAHINYVPASSPDLMKLIDLRCLLSEALYLDSRKENPISRTEVIEDYKLLRSNVNQIVKSNWESTSSSFLLDEIYPKLYSIILSHLDEHEDTGNSTYLEKAYQILSEFKNQILERDIQSRIHLRENIADSVLTQFYKLKSDLNIKFADVDSSKNSQISLIQEFERYQLKFDSILSREDSLLTLNPKTLTEIQQDLSANDAFLDLYYANEKLIRFWITNDEIKVTSANLANDLLFEFLNKVKSGDPINKPSNDSIFNALFFDVNLNNIKNVIVHADGLFHKLPLGAITNPISNKFLIEDFSFRYLLSTDSIYTEDYMWKGNLCLGVASDYNLDLNHQHQVDSFTINISKLTGTTDELSNLFEYYKTDSLINRNASFDNLYNQTSKQNYNIVQLSMHGMMDDRYPALSGLVFEAQSGIELVDMNKMTGLNLNTDLTIINSCHSGDGKHISGEAISNLNTSLFISGSKANIVNLWSSSDVASSDILKNFHKELAKGKSKSKALQLAKKEYLTTTSPSFRHPKYWSSLVLFGNDSPLHKNNFNLHYLLLFLLFSSVAIFFTKNISKKRS